LLRIPGVYTVRAGLKWQGGRLTDQPALIVYVRRKLPLEEVAPRDRVPREIAGMPTDVVEADMPVNAQTSSDPAQPTMREFPWSDPNEYTQIRGGIRCEGAGNGPIGCVARATGTQNND